MPQRKQTLCLFGTDGRLRRTVPGTADAIGRLPCPHPEVQAKHAGGKALMTCSGCLVDLAASRQIDEPAHPIRTLADILSH